jgi:hypothetical protein
MNSTLQIRNTVRPKSNGGVSNDYIVGVKHDRHMKQVSNERQTHQVFHPEVGGTRGSGGAGGREGKQLCAQRIQGDAHSPSDLQKMAAVQRKVQFVLWLAKFESVTQVRREYRRVFNAEPPHESNIRR